MFVRQILKKQQGAARYLARARAEEIEEYRYYEERGGTQHMRMDKSHYYLPARALPRDRSPRNISSKASSVVHVT